jgi:hypothetical protein
MEHVYGSVSLNDQEHSPHARGEDLIQQFYARDGFQYGIQHIEACSSH